MTCLSCLEHVTTGVTRLKVLGFKNAFRSFLFCVALCMHHHAFTLYLFMVHSSSLNDITTSEQDRQCTCNVTPTRVRESLLPWKSNKCYIFVCVYVRARARAFLCPGAWACVCAYVPVALLIQYATRMRHIVTSFVTLLASPQF